jgi:hypothetical protein
MRVIAHAGCTCVCECMRARAHVHLRIEVCAHLSVCATVKMGWWQEKSYTGTCCDEHEH